MSAIWLSTAAYRAVLTVTRKGIPRPRKTQRPFHCQRKEAPATVDLGRIWAPYGNADKQDAAV